MRNVQIVRIDDNGLSPSPGSLSQYEHPRQRTGSGRACAGKGTHSTYQRSAHSCSLMRLAATMGLLTESRRGIAEAALRSGSRFAAARRYGLGTPRETLRWLQMLRHAGSTDWDPWVEANDAECRCGSGGSYPSALGCHRSWMCCWYWGSWNCPQRRRTGAELAWYRTLVQS
jgi:hypothetical protein